MQSIDFVIGLIIALGFTIGYLKGFTKQVASLLGILLGIYVAKTLYVEGGIWVMRWTNLSVDISRGVAFISLFLLILGSCCAVGYALSSSLKGIKLTWINKIGGSLFSGLKYILILSIFANLLDLLDVNNDLVTKEVKSSSSFYQPLKEVTPRLFPIVKTLFKK